MRSFVACSLSTVSSIVLSSVALVTMPAIYAASNASAYAQSKEAISRVAHTAEISGDLALAENMWLQHSQLFPDDETGYVALGYVLLEQGKTADAMTAFEAALGISSQSVGAHVGMGTIAQAAGDFEAAETAFRKVIEINQQAPVGYLKLGRLLRNKRDFAGAAENFEIMTQIKPVGQLGAIAYWELGKLHMSQNQPDEAALDYRRAIGLDADNLEFWQSLSSAVREQGQTSELASIAGEIKRIKESNQQQLKERETVLAERFDLESDRQQASQVQTLLQTNPDNVTFLQELGTALRQLGDFEGAAEALQQATLLSPNNARAFYNLSEALRDLDQIEAADAAYQTAAALYPDIAPPGQTIRIEASPNSTLQVTYQTISNPPIPQTLSSSSSSSFLPSLPRRAFPTPTTRFPLTSRTVIPRRFSRVSIEEQVQLDPDNAALHGNKADKLRREGNLPEATAAYVEMARLDPRTASLAFNNVGVLLNQQEQFEAAEIAFSNAMGYADQQISDENNYYRVETVYENFGRMLEQQGNWQKAAEVYKLALERGIGDEGKQTQWETSRDAALRSLARASVKAEQYDIAVRAYEELITDFAAQSNLADELATVLFKQGELAAAESVYRAAIAAAPEREYYLHHGLVAVLKEQGRAQEAEAIAARFRPAPISRNVITPPEPLFNRMPRPTRPSLAIPNVPQVFNRPTIPIRRPTAVTIPPAPAFPRPFNTTPPTPVRVFTQSPLARVYDNFAQEKLEQGQYNAVEAVLLQVSERDRGAPENLLTLGLAQLYQGETDTGYSNLSQAAQLNFGDVVRCYAVPAEVATLAWLPDDYLRQGESCLF